MTIAESARHGSLEVRRSDAVHLYTPKTCLNEQIINAVFVLADRATGPRIVILTSTFSTKLAEENSKYSDISRWRQSRVSPFIHVDHLI
jgi:hypothetical protein